MLIWLWLSGDGFHLPNSYGIFCASSKVGKGWLSSILFWACRRDSDISSLFCLLNSQSHDEHTLSISPEFYFPFACSAKGMTHSNVFERVLNTWNLKGTREKNSQTNPIPHFWLFVLFKIRFCMRVFSYERECLCLCHPSLFTKCIEDMDFLCVAFYFLHHQYEVNVSLGVYYTPPCTAYSEYAQNHLVNSIELTQRIQAHKLGHTHTHMHMHRRMYCYIVYNTGTRTLRGGESIPNRAN